MIIAYIVLLFLVATIILALLYAIAVIDQHRKRSQEIRWLKQHGTRVNATVLRIEERQELQMERTRDIWLWSDTNHKWERHAGTMDREPQWQETWPTRYYVLAEWRHPQTQETYTAESARLYVRPKQYTPGSVVSVVVDPQDPTRYYMDLSAA
jgi:hypothetical protein